DPTKWILWTFARLGITKNLRRTPASAIARARLRMDRERMARHGIPSPWRERVEQTFRNLQQTLGEWRALSRQRRLAVGGGSRTVSASDRGTTERQLRAVRRAFRRSYRDWKVLLQRVDRECSLLARNDLHPSG